MDKNKPQAKGIRTFLQVVPGFLLGLITTVIAVPGVTDAAWHYITTEGIPVLATLGLSTGIWSAILSFGQNKVEDK